jgi:hypothetical protein
MNMFHQATTKILMIPQKRLRLSDNQIDPKPSTSRATDYIVDRVMETIEGVIEDSVASDDNVEEEIPRNSGDLAWNSVTGLNLKNLLFTEPNPGVNTELYAEYYMKSPLEFYELFLDEEILSMMVTETNRYAAQCRAKQNAPKAIIHDWQDTTAVEMKKIIGIILWMGLVQYPSIESYWSKIYQNFIKCAMSRNRFQLLLKIWHFSNNENLSQDRLQKISPLINMLVEKFQNNVIPKEAVCIDETLVPFRGRLSFRQFIKNKRHKFGIKLYRVATKYGNS